MSEFITYKRLKPWLSKVKVGTSRERMLKNPGAAAAVFVTCLLGLVYLGAPGAAQAPAVEILRDASILPPEAQRMRQAILAAAASGDIENLRAAADLNELPPMFAKEKTADPVAYWKKVSGDGEGREVLAAVVELFRAGFVRKKDARDEIFIWPYFAEMPLEKLTPAQEVELLTLTSAARAKEMREKNKYSHYRLGISAKGVWHFFHLAE